MARGRAREVYLRRVAALDIDEMTVSTSRHIGAAAVAVAAELHNTTRMTVDMPRARAARRRPGACTREVHHHACAAVEPRAPVALRRHAAAAERSEGRRALRRAPLAPDTPRPRRGAALTPLDRATLANQLASLGANFTRAHYPLHPALLDAFDRLGIVYWDEIPVWRLRGSQLTPAVRSQALSLLRRTIERDRNHTSVMAWGAENETLRGGAAEAAYLHSAHALAHRLDPSRFLVAETPVSPLDQIARGLAECDLIGFNEYLGWYSGHVDQLPQDLAPARALFPGKGIFISETGAEASRPGAATVKGAHAFQSRFLGRQLATLSRAPNLNGILVWLLRDFVARPRWSGGDPRAHPPLSTKGLLHENGAPKPAFDAVRRAFGPRVAEAGSSR